MSLSFLHHYPSSPFYLGSPSIFLLQSTITELNSLIPKSLTSSPGTREKTKRNKETISNPLQESRVDHHKIEPTSSREEKKNHRHGRKVGASSVTAQGKRWAEMRYFRHHSQSQKLRWDIDERRVTLAPGMKIFRRPCKEEFGWRWKCCQVAGEAARARAGDG
ncbi:hypothetical protein BJX64DRAFT_257924 [Aspergillus heterothallicus]